MPKMLKAAIMPIRQRVGIARALVVEPKVLLMDDPFSSLDELTAETLCREVLEIWREPTKVTDTFVMVTHNVREAVFMTDRIIVLGARPGKVVADIKIEIPRPREDYVHSEDFYKCEQNLISIMERNSTPAQSAQKM
jgi:NitT/TauT family transport system ATP-binding protein